MENQENQKKKHRIKPDSKSPNHSIYLNTPIPNLFNLIFTLFKMVLNIYCK